MANFITTENGEVDLDLCEKREGSHENDNEIISWTEYWQGETLISRSAHIHVKQGIEALLLAEA